MNYYLLIGIATSMLFTLIGALFKIQSWEGGGVFLTVGILLFPLVVIGFAIYKIIEAQKSKEKLDLRNLPKQEKEKVLLEHNEDMII